MAPRMPLTWFAGFNHCPQQWIIPMPIAMIQTDGSFHQSTRSGAVAAILDLPTGSVHKYVQPLPTLISSTEAEWASVFYGISLAHQMNQPIVGLENDCLGIVRSILFNSPGKHDYAKYYNYKIHRLGRELEWCGIRWIPRAENKSDALFRSLKSNAMKELK